MTLNPRLVLSGLALGGSLIVAIGAQNAFVLRQGLRRRFVLAVATICTLSDWALMTLGAVGFGSLVAAFPLVTHLAAWGGAAFLLVYGALSFRSVFTRKSLDAEAEGTPEADSLRAVVLITLAVSWLNPHALLDTVVLIGGLAGQYTGWNRASFVTGTGLASLIWFFALAYGARLLAPVFRRPAAWQVLDALIGLVMWAIATSLILGELSLR
jgi:L-lysine exporter family protein LysE/ArgO